MTHAEILAQVLSEVSGQPHATCAAVLASFQKCFPTIRLDQEVSRREATRLLSRLRKELSSDPASAPRWGCTSCKSG